MIIDGERLIIDFNIGLDALEELKVFIEPRLKYIEEIVSENDVDSMATIGLFQLLVAIKKAKSDISIPFLEAQKYEDKELGTITWGKIWM